MISLCCSVLLIAADLGDGFWCRGVTAFGIGISLIEAGAGSSSGEKSHHFTNNLSQEETDTLRLAY
jgi:hypothetical protein